MRGEVISTFRDKFHFDTVYEVGAVVDFEKERMEDLFARKLCKRLEDIEKPIKKGKKEKKTVLENPEPKEETKKEVLTEAKEEVGEQEKSEELDEKTKSEQEAAEKIARAVAKNEKN